MCSYTLPTAFAATQLTTPEKLRALYKVPNPVGTHPANSQAVVSFEEQYWSMSDLQRFFEATGTRPIVPTVIGYNDDSNPGGEASLDIQWIAGVGQGVPTVTWSFPVGDYILNWAIAVANTTDAPLVTSISYGDTELGYLQKSGYGAAYIARMEQELQNMAMRGLTVVAGSGDAGWTNVGEMGNDLSDVRPAAFYPVAQSRIDCFLICIPSRRAQPDPDCSVMRAFYPSLSPWVLSLSSVFLTRTRSGKIQEAVISVSQVHT
jgi:subtilase family serine protease